MQTCILFEDALVDRLRPINLARPTHTITCGACSLQDLLLHHGLALRYSVRPHLQDVAARTGSEPLQESAGPNLYVNAALVPDLQSLERIVGLARDEEPFLAVNDQRVTAAWCPEDIPAKLVERGGTDLASFLLGQRLPLIDDEFAILDYPSDVIRHHETLLPGHLAHLVEHGEYRTIADHVYVGEDADIASNVVFDTDEGPILLGNNVRVRPFSYLAGPVRVGDNSLIIDHAAIKHGTVLGHTVKAGGEVEAAIIEPYSNKQHHGFLGHAYVGSWVNLGAGTSNSDLKNTYGEVSIEVDGRPVPTGLQFFGCVIGDFSKTAINTSILTGKLVGVASLVYGFVSTNVPSFTNYARSFGQVTEVAVGVALKAQTRAARRRHVDVTDIDRQLMHDLYELTRSERQLSSEQIVL